MTSPTIRAKHRHRRESQRDAILRAADRFLRLHPYRELSVETLMADSGLTRTSFYRHFNGLPQVILELLETASAELTSIATDWSTVPDTDLHSAAHDALERFVAFFVRHGPVIAAVSQATSYDEEIEKRYRDLQEVFVSLTCAGFERLGHANAAELALALNLMNERFLLEQFGDPARPGDPRRATATLEWIWLGAMRPPQ